MWSSIMGFANETMDEFSFIKDSPPEWEINSFVLYGSSVLMGLIVLRRLSISGRPVAHPDRKLGSKHKAAQAERVEILEKLSSGSKAGDAQFNAGDAVRQLVNDDLSDVEKDPLCVPLTNSVKEANAATITLSSAGSRRLPSMVYESMKGVSEAAASGEFGDDCVLCNPETTMFQTKVELYDGIFQRLRELVPERVPEKESMPPTSSGNTPILQVDNWAILKGSDQGIDFLRLPVDKVPVILHAEYAAGLLTITGLNLEDASILVSGQNAESTVKLKVFRFLKGTEQKWYRWQSWGAFSDTEEDIMLLPLRLYWTEVEDVFVYATKKVQLGVDGKSVDAVSKSARITHSVWKTVLGLWISSIAVWIFTIHNMRGLLRSMPPFAKEILGPQLFGPNSFLMFWIFIVFFNPSHSLVEFFKYHGENIIRALGQGVLLFYYGIQSLKGPGLKFPSKFPSSDVQRGPLLSKTPPPPPPPSRVRSRLLSDSRSDRAHLTTSVEAADVQSVNDPNWEWPIFELYEDKRGRSEQRRCFEKPQDDVSPFQVLYRRKKHQLWPEVVQIDLISAPLIKIVQKFLPQNGDLQSLSNPKINGKDLFIVLHDLKNYEAPACSADTLKDNPRVDGELEGRLHLKHLIRFMDKQYTDVSVRLRRMTEEKRVAWDMLWTFLTPGRRVVYTCDHTEELLTAVVSKNSYELVLKFGEWAFTIDLEVWNYDGRRYRQRQTQRMITKFDGELEFSSLAVRPIEIEGVPEILDEGFLANGKRFYELAVENSHRFMHYSGHMFQLKRIDGYSGLVKEKADGRVMIDLASFAKMNPGYQMGTAKPPVSDSRERHGDLSVRRIGLNEESAEILDVGHSSQTVADESLIFAPAIVYGFSFALKQWGSFAVSGFSEISFDTNSFDALVMEPDSKHLVYKLVSQYTATPVGPSQALQRVDPIANKGEGCIFMCYGPPGTGKTLTAESVAESLHYPLWSLNASELGTTASSFQKSLLEVLNIAATWQAVILLDEADVFFEKRTMRSDLTRNAMTGVFLRFLEYYRGVLFLTTNRIESFDNAFRSRISMFLRYPKLTIQNKVQVWMTLLERAGVKDITAGFVSEMAAEELNGREIRNSIHTAQILAKSDGQALDQSHVRYATRFVLSSLATLSDAMATSKGNEA